MAQQFHVSTLHKTSHQRDQSVGGGMGGVTSTKLIKNFLCENEVNLLKDYCRIMHRQNKGMMMAHYSDFNSSFYGDPVMESLLLNKRKAVEKEVNLKLSPTYSYFRVYTFRSDLPKHKDRPSCEISVTIHIGSDGTPWPLFVEDKIYETQPGDAIIYRGCEVEHWREPFEGDWHAQTFLHYVNFDGPHKEFYMDKRRMWADAK